LHPDHVHAIGETGYVIDRDGNKRQAPHDIDRGVALAGGSIVGSCGGGGGHALPLRFKSDRRNGRVIRATGGEMHLATLAENRHVSL